jgi:hypothetical protein
MIAASTDPGGVAESARASPEETLVEFDVVFLHEVRILRYPCRGTTFLWMFTGGGAEGRAATG